MDFTLPETIETLTPTISRIDHLLVWLHRQLSIVKIGQMCEGILPNKNLILRSRLSVITVVIWLNILRVVMWA